MKIVKIEECEVYEADEHALAREFLGPRNTGLKNLSVAEITIPPGVRVKKHYHLKSEETYHVVQGQGMMHLDGEEHPLGPGEAVAIQPGQWHTIENRRQESLVMIVTCSPPWSPHDQVFA